jgi:hypothetical protein
MSHVLTHEFRRFVPSSGQSDLRRRIGWICHALRIAVVLWIGWDLANFLIVWSNKARMLETAGWVIGTDLSGVSSTRLATAFALGIVDWSIAAAVAVCIWRLFGTYLAGRVFTVDAALWLRRTALAVIAAGVGDLIIRFLSLRIVIGRFLLVPAHTTFINPQDLLHLIFGVFIFALAHVFKAAAEIAEDHAQIV